MKLEKILLRAINNHCKECCGDIVAEIERCPIKKCKLYKFRSWHALKSIQKRSRKPQERFGTSETVKGRRKASERQEGYPYAQFGHTKPLQ